MSKASTKMSDDQFTEMKERINQLISEANRYRLDIEELVAVNNELRSHLVRAKIKAEAAEKKVEITVKGQVFVPVTSLQVDVLTDLVLWFEHPGKFTLQEIVERARFSIKTVEQEKTTP